jgi:Tol biopolymer transport system component
MPVMSPDGSSIAFVYPMGFGGGLLTLPVQGGPPTVVVAEGVRDGGGGIAWDSDGWLYYAAQDGAVMRVSASGGTPEELARPEPGVAYQWFGALPDTRGLLVTIGSGAAADSRIGVLDIETGEVRPLMPGTTARYSPTGHLVYASSDSSLAAVAFDLETLDLVPGAEPIPLPDRVDVNAGSASQFAIAENGTLAYATGTRCCPNRPVRVDRTGNAIPVDPDWSINASADFSSLSLSPAGDRLAFNTLSDGSVSVWVKPVDGGPVERITFGAASMAEYRANWAPDAESIVFVADWRGHGDLWTTRTDGLGEPELLLDAKAPIHQGSYSPDGQWIVYQSGQARESDIFAARVGAEEDPIPIRATEFLEHEPALSPDSRWLAYVSDASGQDEVYVVSFPDPTSSGRVSVSSGGGTEPAWARDGRELFYRSGDDRLVSVMYDGEEDFSITGRQELFSLEGFVEGLGRTLIEPGDGQTFYMLQPIPSPSPTRIILVQNLLGSLGSS